MRIMKNWATYDSISFHSITVKIKQKKEGYRFAIDSVLLSDFVKIKKSDKELFDIGTGSGIIALLLAKSFPHTKITGIELQRGLFELAKENVSLNGLEGRIFIENIAIRDVKKRFKPSAIDCVFTNPPYRKIKSGRINPAEEKAIARHEIETSLDEIIKVSRHLLSERGSLFLIYLPERLSELIYLLKRDKIEPKRMRVVYSKEGDDAEFILLEAIKGAREGMKIERPLYIFDKSGGYTKEVKGIYGVK